MKVELRPPTDQPQVVRVCPLAELRLGEIRRVESAPPIAVARTATGVYALTDRCSHAGTRLSDGVLVGDQVECPLHGARFDLATGAACSRPARRPVATHEVSVRDGQVFVATPPRYHRASWLWHLLFR